MIRNLDIDGIIVVWDEEKGEDVMNMENVTYKLSFPDDVTFYRCTGIKLVDTIKGHINGKDKIAKKIKEFKGVKVSVTGTWCTGVPVKK